MTFTRVASSACMDFHQSASSSIAHQTNVLVMGISGATCSGKTTVTRNLCQKFPHTITIHQDLFYLYAKMEVIKNRTVGRPGNKKYQHCQEDSKIPKTQMGTPHFDVLESLDQEELVGRVRSVVECPHKHCVTCKQHKEDSGAVHLVLLEGSMILSLSQLKPLLYSSLFITLDFELCKQRRSLRGDYVLPDPPRYLEDYVWPEYVKQKKELEKDASVQFLDGGSSLKFLVQEAEAFVRSCMRQLTATDHPGS